MPATSDRGSVDEFAARRGGSARHRTLGCDIASINWAPAADNASCSRVGHGRCRGRDAEPSTGSCIGWAAATAAEPGGVLRALRAHAWVRRVDARPRRRVLPRRRGRRWRPAGPQHTAGVLRARRARLPHVPAPAPNDDATRTVSADDFPWVHVAARAAAEGRGGRRPRRGGGLLAGAARSFVNPFVWGSIRDHVLRAEPSSPLDLFLVLGTGPEANPRIGLHPAPHPRLLEAALDALQPKRVRFQLWPQRFPCGKSSAGQFAKWAHCVEEVEAHEAEAAGGGRRGERPPQLYDFIFKGRPDVAWLRPLRLHALASMLAPATLLTSNDVNVLGDREAGGGSSAS